MVDQKLKGIRLNSLFWNKELKGFRSTIWEKILELSHIITEKFHFWPKHMLKIVLVSAKDGFTRPPRTQNKFIFVLTSLLLSCFILLIPKIVLFGPIHYVPVPSFNSKKGCVASQTSTIHIVLHESNFTVLNILETNIVFQILKSAFRGSKLTLEPVPDMSQLIF